MLHRVIYNADDSVMIMSPNLDDKLKDETDTEQLERNYQNYISTHPQYDGLLHDDLDTSALPLDRSNRAKWRKKVGGGVKVDSSIVLPKEARAIDEALLKTEQKKTTPDLKVALGLMIKLQENNY
jgi:hypothetical protein